MIKCHCYILLTNNTWRKIEQKKEKFIMDNSDVEKIEKILEERKSTHDFLIERSKTYGSFIELAKNAFSPGVLDSKTKELMAVSISVVIHCEACAVWHIGAALRAGATDQEILESMDVAIELGGGPATVSIRFALKALEYFRTKGKKQIMRQ